jgi:hypothetical protein
MMRRQTKPYYSTYDPRVGLRVSAFLYRYGLHLAYCVVSVQH